MENKADIVIGIRDIANIEHFSRAKKFFHKFGSFIVRQLSNLPISDPTSGFRAFSREAALKLNIYSKFTYTLESLIQAGYEGLRVYSVPIEVNPKTRDSRLFTSIYQYIIDSAITLIRIYAMYRPFRTFTFLSTLPLSSGILIGLRFLFYFFRGEGKGKVQSLILSAILIIVGFQILILALLSDIIAGNRKLIEKILYLIKIRYIKKSF